MPKLNESKTFDWNMSTYSDLMSRNHLAETMISESREDLENAFDNRLIDQHDTTMKEEMKIFDRIYNLLESSRDSEYSYYIMAEFISTMFQSHTPNYDIVLERLQNIFDSNTK